MKKNTKIILSAGGSVLLAAALGGRYLMIGAPAHIGMGIDPSLSVERNCEGLQQAARHLIVGNSAIRNGSTLSILVMGGDAGNPQPSLIFNRSIPIPSDNVMGREERDGEITADQRKLFDGMKEACEGVAVTRSSPIRQLVVEGIAHLQSKSLNCRTKAPCYFVVKTDLDEDVDEGLRDLLDRAALDPAIEVPSGLANSIDNAGIEIQFCGTAEIAPHRERRHRIAAPETRAQIWKALFTHPELVSFRPFCGDAGPN